MNELSVIIISKNPELVSQLKDYLLQFEINKIVSAESVSDVPDVAKNNNCSFAVIDTLTNDLSDCLSLAARLKQIDVCVFLAGTAESEPDFSNAMTQGVAVDYIHIPLKHDQLYRSVKKNLPGIELKQQAVEQDPHFRLFYQNSPLSYQSLDETGCIVEVNPAWLDMLGQKRQQVIGRKITDFMVPGQEELFFERFPVFKQTGKIRGVCFKLLHSDGRTIDVEIDGNIAYDENGKFKQTHCVIRDVTQKRKIEEDRQQLNESLTYKNHELQTILHILSHDLKVPLVTIKGFVKELEMSAKKLDLLIKDSSAEPDEKKQFSQILTNDIAESYNYISSAAGSVNSMLDGLIKLARLDNAELKYQQIDMNDVFSDIQAQFAYQIQNARVIITARDLPDCLGDKVLLRQVFLNLFANSMKYLHQDRHGQITLSGRVDDGFVVYCLEDNGIGISQDEISKIFDLFYRSQVSAELGQGLGLTIVSRIVQKHKGRVWAKSEQGKGSKFFISLPLSPDSM